MIGETVNKEIYKKNYIVNYLSIDAFLNSNMPTLLDAFSMDFLFQITSFRIGRLFINIIILCTLLLKIPIKALKVF